MRKARAVFAAGIGTLPIPKAKRSSRKGPDPEKGSVTHFANLQLTARRIVALAFLATSFGIALSLFVAF